MIRQGWTEEVRHAIRSLARSRRFTAAGVSILAIGLGAAGLAFSLVRTVLLAPLPFDRPDELYQVLVRHPGQSGDYETTRVEGPVLDAWQAGAARLGGPVASNEARHETVFYLSGAGEPQRVAGAFVSRGFFELLGRRPVLGAMPQVADGTAAVLSYALWQRMFGGDRTVLGRTIDVNGSGIEIAAIMPPDFVMPPPVGTAGEPQPIDAWVIGFGGGAGGPADYDRAFVRVPADLSPEAAAAQLSVLARSVQVAQPVSDIRLQPLRELIVGPVRSGLVMMSIVVGLGLLLTCASIGAIQLARFSSRGREIAIRSALGAGRARVFGHLLAEGLLLALMGGVAGILLAAVTGDIMLSIAPSGLPGTAAASADGAMIAFTLAAALAVGLAATVWPAAIVVRSRHGEDPLRTRGATATRARHRARGVLVAAQIVVTVALLAGTGALTRSMVRLFAESPGSAAGDAVVFDVHRRIDAAGVVDYVPFYDRLLEGARNLPGITSAALASSVPYRPRDYYGPEWRRRIVTGDYFEVLGVPLLAGRPFEGSDTRAAAPVGIINRALARQTFGERDPLGALLDDVTIVGVVPDIRHESLDERAEPALYVPFQQAPDSRMSLIVRGAASADATIASVRTLVRDLDPAQPVATARTLSDIVDRSDAVRRRSFLLRILVVLGLFAAALAALGVHGVAGQVVVERTTELGVRIALGATRGEVVRLVLRDALAPAAAGIVGGWLLALALIRALEGVLYGVGIADPVVMAAATLGIGVTALVACLTPVRRAALTEPMVVLRRE